MMIRTVVGTGRSMRIVLATLPLLWFGSLPVAAQQASVQVTTLDVTREPYQLMRSLRQLQDQVVSGKPQAVTMLNRLLAGVGEDMGRMPDSIWQKPANLYAAVLYLLNGGNPQAVRGILSSAPKGVIADDLLDGALAYVEGDTMRMMQAFSIPPFEDVPLELTASVVLVAAGQMAALDPATALARLDRVRLDVPGTLFEEAAIRRSLKIAARLGDTAKIRLLVRNYLQRFSVSPYAQDFFQQFVSAILLLDKRISNADVAQLIENAPPSLQYALYLRVARGALVEGQTERARFMSGRAQELARDLKADASQALLYSAASQVTSVGANEAIKELHAIPKERLHESDRKLLRAAEAIGAVVVSLPSVERARTSENAKSGAAEPVKVEPQNLEPQNLEPVNVETAAVTPVVADPDWRQPVNNVDLEFEKTLEDVRLKLFEVDELLGKAAP